MLDDCTEKHPRKKTCKKVKAVTQWVKVETIQLYERDKRNLILQSGWLDDRVINSAQALLKSTTHTPGLQCTNLGSNLSFEVVKESFVQILHNGTNHWVTVSTINTQPSHINIYDSKYSTITESLRDQICALMHSCQRTITVHHINTYKQENGHDCGLYAIAYATSLCNGDDVTSLHYNSQKMREHLVQCLQTRQMLNFPSNMVKRAQTFVNEELINLYCHCRQPQSSFMIECSGCSEWYHKECETSIPKTAYYLKNKWYCRNCKRC